MEENRDNTREENIEKQSESNENSLESIEEDLLLENKQNESNKEHVITPWDFFNKIKIPKKKYEEPRTDYPLFLQISNGCGLSSTLMLMDPLKNEELKEFLDTVWGGVKTILMQSKKELVEYEWSYALEYLLLKALGNNMISEYLVRKIPDFETYKLNSLIPLHGFRQKHLEQNRGYIAEAYDMYFKEGIVNSFIIEEHIGIMKHNPELRMILEILGYEFIPQDTDPPQPTRSIWFSKEELENPKDHEVIRKVKVIKTEFEKGAKIMLGMTHHWLAISDISLSDEGIIITMNDPLLGIKQHVKLQNLSEEDQIYFYRKKPNKMKNFWDLTIRFFESDFEKERLALENFKKIIQQEIKKKLLRKKSQKPKKEDLVSIPSVQETVNVKISGNIEAKTIVSKLIGKKKEKSSSEDKYEDKIRKIIRGSFSDYTKI